MPSISVIKAEAKYLRSLADTADTNQDGTVSGREMKNLERRVRRNHGSGYYADVLHDAWEGASVKQPSVSEGHLKSQINGFMSAVAKADLNKDGDIAKGTEASRLTGAPLTLWCLGLIQEQYEESIGGGA